jgi:hypothetical protein
MSKSLEDMTDEEFLVYLKEIREHAATFTKDCALLAHTVLKFDQKLTLSMADHLQETYKHALFRIYTCEKVEEELPKQTYNDLKRLEGYLKALNKKHAGPEGQVFFKLFKIGEITKSPLVHLDSSFEIIDGSSACAIKGDDGVSILWHKTNFEKGKDGNPFYKPWDAASQDDLGYLNPYDGAYYNRYVEAKIALREAAEAASSVSASKSSSLTPEKDSKAEPVKDIGKKPFGSSAKAEGAAEVTPVGDVDPFAESDAAHRDVAGDTHDNGGCCTVM